MERTFNYARILATGAPAPLATVKVYFPGTLDLAPIFDDNLPTPTPKANPFTTDTAGFLYFYARPGQYDLRFEGGGIVTPYTWGDVPVQGFWTTVTGFGDDTTDDTANFTAALTKSDHILVPPGVYKVSNFTVAQTKTIQFMRGAILHVDDLSTVQVNGAIVAGHWEIFRSTNISTATAPVRFNGGCLNDEISAAWWGAVGDDAVRDGTGTDNSVTLQQAFIACTNITGQQTRNGMTLVVPPGCYDHSKTLYLLATQSGVSEAPGVQTQNTYGFTIRGSVGGKMNLGTSILTSALMHTCLRYTGTGAGTEKVGIEVGDEASGFAAIGGEFQHLWFATASGANVRANVRGYMDGAKFDTCLFSGAGSGIVPLPAANPYVDCGLRLFGFNNLVHNCTFSDTYGGVWFDRANSCTVQYTTFKGTRAAGVYAYGGSIHIIRNTFQDLIGAAVAADMSTLNGSITGMTIWGNYLENNVVGGVGGFFDISGRALNDTAKGVEISANSLNSVGPSAPAYIRFIMTDGCKVGHNFYPDFPPSGGLTKPLIGVTYDASGNTNLTLEKIGRTIAVANGTTNLSLDLQACQNTYTNGGASATSTITIPRGVTGVTFGPVYKLNDQTLILDPAGGGTIDGGANMTNNTSGDTGKAGIMLECVAVDTWVTKHKTGTWATV